MGWWTLFISLRIAQGTLAIVFNLATIVAVLKFPFLRSGAYILVMSLSASDLLHGMIFNVLFPTRLFFASWPTSKYLCDVQIRLDLSLAVVQLSMFSLLSVERYRSLMAQIGQGERWRQHKAILMVIITWVFVLALLVCMLVTTRDYPATDACLIVRSIQLGFIYFAASYVVLTCFVTGFFYRRIAAITLKSQGRVAPDNQTIPNTSQIQRRKMEVRLSKMMGMVVGLFFTLYLPFVIITPTMREDSTRLHHFIKYCTIFIYDCNFWINPLIYAWRDRKFKRAFQLMGQKIPGVRLLGAFSPSPNTSNFQEMRLSARSNPNNASPAQPKLGSQTPAGSSNMERY